MYFSDIYCDRRLPACVRKNELLWGECIAGAMYVTDFVHLAKKVGFQSPRLLSCSPITVSNPGMRQLLGAAKFASITYRLFKLPDLLEPECEDYGQLVLYKGTVPGSEGEYVLDAEHSFEVGKPTRVCGNTAAMVGEGGQSWLARHFEVVGGRDKHYGVYPGCGAVAFD